MLSDCQLLTCFLVLAMALDRKYFNLDQTTLQTLLTDYTNCLIAISVAGQRYQIGQREFWRPDIKEVGNTIAELNAALRYAQGKRITRTRLTVFPQNFGGV